MEPSRYHSCYSTNWGQTWGKIDEQHAAVQLFDIFPSSPLYYIELAACQDFFHPNLNITRDGCGTTELCLASPDNCDPAGNDSCMFVSFEFVVNVSEVIFRLKGDSRSSGTDPKSFTVIVATAPFPQFPPVPVISHSPCLCSTLPAATPTPSAQLHSPAAQLQLIPNQPCYQPPLHSVFARLFFCFDARLSSVVSLPDSPLSTLPVSVLPASPVPRTTYLLSAPDYDFCLSVSGSCRGGQVPVCSAGFDFSAWPRLRCCSSPVCSAPSSASSPVRPFLSLLPAVSGTARFRGFTSFPLGSASWLCSTHSPSLQPIDFVRALSLKNGLFPVFPCLPEFLFARVLIKVITTAQFSKVLLLGPNRTRHNQGQVGTFCVPTCSAVGTRVDPPIPDFKHRCKTHLPSEKQKLLQEERVSELKDQLYFQSVRMERGRVLLFAALMIYTTCSTLNITRDGCGTTELCLASPDNCDPAGSSSCMFVSFEFVPPAPPNVSKVIFRLRGDSSFFITVGLIQNPSQTFESTQHEVVGNIVKCQFSWSGLNSSSTRGNNDLDFIVILGQGVIASFSVLGIGLTTGLLDLSNPRANIPTTTAPTSMVSTNTSMVSTNTSMVPTAAARGPNQIHVISHSPCLCSTLPAAATPTPSAQLHSPAAQLQLIPNQPCYQPPLHSVFARLFFCFDARLSSVVSLPDSPLSTLPVSVLPASPVPRTTYLLSAPDYDFCLSVSGSCRGGQVKPHEALRLSEQLCRKRFKASRLQ
ncbi:hypothetical protein D4764_15G0004490 [Takifugu flavidus]|uniref:Uncharacterized protein n=1 Tax=Takifugu flavidus TaxID=433684 RepID=A0A5C6P171_9TELE|nr:hypothetical protein D4764_15G0004490 [Takifugu flavidus]